MTTWNKTGTCVGRLDASDLNQILVTLEDRKLRKKLLHWLEMTIEYKVSLFVSFPYKGVSPTINEDSSFALVHAESRYPPTVTDIKVTEP